MSILVSVPIVLSTTPLPANATFTSPPIPLTAQSGDLIIASGSDQAGTIYINLSDDGVNYYNAASGGAGGGAASQVIATIAGMWKFAQIAYVNGATAQARMLLKWSQRVS